MKLTFQCEVLTPMFLGGADTGGNPELRAPSIRGALRYWFRALVGGICWTDTRCDDAEKLLVEKESEVFGSTGGRSSVSVLVIPEERIIPQQFKKDRATGRDYLLWSMAESGRPGDARHRPARCYIAPGSKFQIKLQTSASGHENIKKAAAALWLLGNLGSLGSRANRGAGSLQVMLEASVPEIPLLKTCSTIDELQSYLSEGIRQCLEAVAGKYAGWRTIDLPPYDIIAPSAAEIWIVADTKDGWNSEYQALNALGEKLRDFRHHNAGIGKEDHDVVLGWMEKGENEKPNIKRAVFGLPLPFGYSQGGPRDVIQPCGDRSRRASPLKIRVTRLATGAYVGVLVLFKSRFLPEKAELQLQTRKWKAPVPTDYTVIQEFMQTFSLKRGVFHA